MQIIKTSAEALETLNTNVPAIGQSEDCGKLGRVFRPMSLRKEPLSGICNNTFEIALAAGTSQTLFDDLNWYTMNNALPPAVTAGGKYTFLSTFYASGGAAGFVGRMTGIQKMVLTELRVAVIDAQAFTGSIQIVRVDMSGLSSVTTLDFNQAIRPKSLFGWLYEFRNQKIVLDAYTTIRINNPTESIKLSVKFGLLQNSVIMRML